MISKLQPRLSVSKYWPKLLARLSMIDPPAALKKRTAAPTPRTKQARKQQLKLNQSLLKSLPRKLSHLRKLRFGLMLLICIGLMWSSEQTLATLLILRNRLLKDSLVLISNHPISHQWQPLALRHLTMMLMLLPAKAPPTRLFS